MGAAAFGAIALTVPGGTGGLLAAGAARGVAGYHAAFLVAGAVCALGAWAASRLPGDRLPGDPHPPRKAG